MKFRNTKYIIAFAFILLGIGIVVATSLPKSFQYYVTVDELMAQENTFLGKELKVAGKVEGGSVQSFPSDHAHKFRVVNAGRVVHVTFHGALPDTFKDGADVVVTGKYQRGGTIIATDVLAKCASRYEEKLKPGYSNPLKSSL